MNAFTKYNTLTGEIICSQTTPEAFPLDELGPQEAYIIGWYEWQDYYVEDGIMTSRPANTASADKSTIVANGVEKLTITGIPDASHIAIVGPGVNETLEETHIAGESLEITVDTPGDYTVHVNSFPAKLASIPFVAT